MNRQKKEPKRERRKLKDLKPFPLQADFFDDLSKHDLQALAKDIAENGLREAIEILPENQAGFPANTITSGHQRGRALKDNGETETVVIVRYDLADADAATIERAFLEANQNRRQLDKLAKARVALRLYEIERNKPRGGLGTHQQGDARDRVGKAIGMSGRHLDRFFRILQKTPIEVQDAFRARRLSLKLAEKVADLKAEDQETIAQRIQEGENPKIVLKEFFGKPDARHKKVGDALASFARKLQCAYDDLADRVDEVRPAHLQRHLPMLKKARRMIRKLMEVGDTEGAPGAPA
jgi:hypothetical protein